MSHPHLSDDRLIEIYFDLDVTANDRAHLQECDACRSRRSNLAETLDDVEVAVTQAADAAFPADRLARQRARIIQRVDQDGRPGRLIAFPAGHTQDSAPRRIRPARWGTVAAAVPHRSWSGCWLSISRTTFRAAASRCLPHGRRRASRRRRPVPTSPTMNCSARWSSRRSALGQPP